MSGNVFANGMHVACKAAKGKCTAALPDVCFSPPEAPPTLPGVPVPYPTTASCKDTTEASKKTSISGKPIMLRNKSRFKKSRGNDGGRAAKKGVVSSTNQGGAMFCSWSPNVRIETENAARHLDIMTVNHMKMPGNSPTWPYIDTMAVSGGNHPCVGDQMKEMEACSDYQPYGDKDACAEAGLQSKPGGGYDFAVTKPQGTLKDRSESLWMAYDAEANDCIAARRCSLKPYKRNKCCPGQTGHHLVEASSFFNVGRGKPEKKKDGTLVPSIPLAQLAPNGSFPYNEDHAPCVCAEGVNQNTGSHGIMHTLQSVAAQQAPIGTLHYADGSSSSSKRVTTYKEAKVNGIAAMHFAFPNADCDPACIESQMDAYHNQVGVVDDTPIEAVSTGKTAEVNREFAEDHSMVTERISTRTRE